MNRCPRHGAYEGMDCTICHMMASAHGRMIDGEWMHVCDAEREGRVTWDRWVMAGLRDRMGGS